MADQTKISLKIVLLTSLGLIDAAASFFQSINHQPSCHRNSFLNKLSYSRGDNENAQGLTHIQDIHNTDIQYTPPSLAVFGEDDWKEWHYSFSRNGLTDFLPQFSPHLDCLMVGGFSNGNGGGNRLPWQKDQQAKITALPLDVVKSDALSQNTARNRRDSGDDKDKSREGLYDNISFDKLVSAARTSLIDVGGNDSQHDYDCILDQGLMDSIIKSMPSKNDNKWEKKESIWDDKESVIQLHVLLLEASRVIREHGIYVMVTDHLLPKHVKDYLTVIGEAVGMEWKFDLDGISSNEKGASVSVARKYFTGELPSFGKLSIISDLKP